MTDGTISSQGFCDKPDRDVRSTRCGYPLPCPWHTAFVDLTGAIPIILVPEQTPKPAVRDIRRVAEALRRDAHVD